MGKYVATRGIQGNKHWRSTGNSIGNGFVGNIQSRDDYTITAFLYNADPTGLYRGYLASRDSTRWMSDYLANTGQSWSDIKYSTQTLGFTSSGGFGRSTMMLSSNIAKLYV